MYTYYSESDADDFESTNNVISQSATPASSSTVTSHADTEYIYNIRKARRCKILNYNLMYTFLYDQLNQPEHHQQRTAPATRNSILSHLIRIGLMIDYVLI